MNFMIWRLHGNQAYFAAAALVVLTTILLVTGSVMAHDYAVALASCGATSSCADIGSFLFRGDGAIMDLVDLTLVTPLLFGLFWGAPLLAKEFEDGTHSLAWTQGVTRARWLRTNVMWALLAAAVWGAAMAALVTWWHNPENALGARFGTFDVQGFVPVAYSLFGVALGIAVGSVIRRVLPALATTLALFLAIRVAIGIYLRPHYETPVAKLYSLLNGKAGQPANSWAISNSIVGPGGHNYGDQFSLNELPKGCASIFPGKGGGDGGMSSCLASHGFHQLVTFQPDTRFWAFQGIEAAIFVVLAAALIGFTFWRVLSRDA